MWGQTQFKVTISLAISLQSIGFVHMWCQMYFKVTISLAFAFKVTILYIFGVKHILK